MLPLPSNTAFVVQNNVKDRPALVAGKDLIGVAYFRNTDSDNYPVQTFDVDPLYLEGTRLNTIAKGFQKYRFRKNTRIIIQTQAPSSTTGSYIAGYTENPDQDMGTGMAATSAIAALYGSAEAPVWVAQSVPMQISDSGKWYNLDSDTIEIMQAVQGKFVIQQVAPCSTSGNLKAPVWLEWECEFVGPAVQKDNVSDDAPIVSLPFGNIQPSPAADGSVFRTAQVGCQIINGSGAVDTTVVDRLYEIHPGFETATGEVINYVWVYRTGGSKYFLFGGTVDDMLQGEYFKWATLFGTDGPQVLECPGAVGYQAEVGEAPRPSTLLRDDQVGHLSSLRAMMYKINAAVEKLNLNARGRSRRPADLATH